LAEAKDDCRRLHREKMDALYGPDGFPRSATAPLATEQRARGLTPEMVVAHYPQTQHQPDECELCHYVFKIAAEALAATALHWVYAAAQAHFRLIMELQDASVEPTGGAHLVWMLEQIKPEKMSPTKACRWLGWIQAVLCERGAASLEELKAVNKAAADNCNKVE
jgi:thioesterase domain-containing protein